MSILITAANSAQAYQLKSILNTDAEVLLGDYLDLPETMLKSGKMIKTPNPNSNTFIHEMLALCLDQSIDTVFALRRAELLQLSEAGQLFTEFEVTLFVPSKEDIVADASISDDKDGKITVIHNGEVIAGDQNALPSGESWGVTSGVFKGSKIFTAD